MRLKVILGVGAALAAAITLPALAAPADDARCTVAAYAVGARAEERAAASGQSKDSIENLAVVVVAYYLGRLKDVSQGDLAALFKANAPPFSDPQLGAIYDACGNQMMERMGPATQSLSFAEP